MTEIQHEKAPSFTSGFHCLGHLVLYRFSGDITAFIVRSIPAGLFDLRLFHVQLDRSLVQFLTPTHSHTLRYVCLSECTQVEEDHVVHLILSTLHGLGFFDVSGDPVIFDPEVLQQTPWVCRNLQELYFIPKCDGSSRYSPLEAQQALMTQIGALTNLRKLYFGRLYSADYKNIMETGFAPEASWTLLSSLTKLKEVDLGFLPEVPLTARDARMMIRYWPHLKELYSVYPKGNEAFVDYMKENRPKLQLEDGPRY
ncbi:hypothetical protein EMPS_07343 [Entomortierella parvispora]|uniref:Uncharacterized protein n=1 Tax=Entomortierella parvispora TaxID=205924 RepID=A0A9P3HDZ2_9FUNG|nr:hypothetical protein EMPS_07343 [Entomortierella parvispora]